MNTTLYQLDSKNKIREWNISVLDNTPIIGQATIQITKGLSDGKKTVDIIVVQEGLNLGKSNATTYYTQALSDAQSRLDSKVKEGYTEDINNLKSNDELGSGVKAPMLAQKYDPTKKQSGSKNLKDLKLEGKTIFVQRKKDGNRMNLKVERVNGLTQATLTTRKGDVLPTNGLEHIINDVIEKFDKSFDYYNSKYGIISYVLDGELFPVKKDGLPVMSFNKLNGLVKKQKKSAEDLQDCLNVRYHLYDVMLPIGYETRYKIIQNFKNTNIHVEEAYEIEATEANIQKHLEMFLEEGEEGLMIRVPGVTYEHKRSWSLIKVKNFEDKEFEVVGFEESIQGGRVGAIIVKQDIPTVDRDGNAITSFKAGVCFTHEECIEMWNNQSKYIGKFVTVEYFGRSEYNVCRFPKAKGFRND